MMHRQSGSLNLFVSLGLPVFFLVCQLLLVPMRELRRLEQVRLLLRRLHVSPSRLQPLYRLVPKVLFNMCPVPCLSSSSSSSVSSRALALVCRAHARVAVCKHVVVVAWRVILALCCLVRFTAVICAVI